MKISNKKKVKSIKRLFYLVSVFIAIAALVLFLIDLTIYALASVGVFSMWYLYFHVADYHYIEFSDEENKIVLRYYKAIRLGGTAYHSIEFPQEMLKNFNFENSVFGKMSDVTLLVKTSRGFAEYPSVSLSALPVEDQAKIKAALVDIVSG